MGVSDAWWVRLRAGRAPQESFLQGPTSGLKVVDPGWERRGSSPHCLREVTAGKGEEQLSERRIYEFPGTDRELEIDSDGAWHIGPGRGQVYVFPGVGQVIVRPGQGQVVVKSGQGQVVVTKDGPGQVIVEG